MKKITLFILILVIYQISAQEIKIYKNKLNPQATPTGILYEKVKVPHKKIRKFTAVNQQKISKPADWLSFYHQMYQANYKKRLPHFLKIKAKAQKDLRKNIFDIGILNFVYNKIDSDFLKSIKKSPASSVLTIPDKNLIKTLSLFAVSPVVTKKYTGRNPVFNFSKDYYFSNIDTPVSYITVDFDDGRGQQKIKIGKKIQVFYNTEGLKTIQVDLHLKDGSIYKSSFVLNVKASSMPNPDEEWEDYTADISWDGSNAVGDVAVFFGEGNTDFTRPVIISDGFDPGNVRNIKEIYDIVNQQNMVDTLRQQSYDLILVDFQGGDDYIQRNAFLLVKLIQDINSRMQASGQMKEANQIVVIGPSMSGLVSRYALDYMESNNIPHNVRNWIAFDSPMRGANIPLGLQHWLRFYAEEAEVEGAQDALNSLKGPAAKQMLTYYYTETSSHKAGNHSLYADFYDEINSMGFPNQTRKVAIANGSGYGNGQEYAPGTQTIEYEYRSTLVDLDGDVWAIPDYTDTKIFYGVYDEWGFWSYEEENIYVNNTAPYDSCPGGTRATFKELADTDTGGYGDIIAYYDDHAFIPSISSMCIQNTDDPYYIINDHLDDLQTPFDKLYYPNTNQSHIEITDESIEWFKHEIINYAPVITSVPLTEIDEGQTYSYIVTATDPNEWNILNYSAVEIPDWLIFDATNQTLSGTPSSEDIGTHSVTIKVSDGLDDTYHSFEIEVFPKCTHAISTIWDGSNWSNGLPDTGKIISLTGDYNTSNHGAIQACSLEVENNTNLTVEENYPVVVYGDVENDGEIIIKNNASFVQSSNDSHISGNGIFKVEKTISNLNHYYDMVFWSIPIASNSFTFGDLLPDAWRYYSFDPSTKSWVFEYADSVLKSGLGYVVSAPEDFDGGDIQVSFTKDTAPFNNGNIEVQLEYSCEDSGNLLGNPYPSAIDFHQLITDNPNLNGSYSLWTNCAGLDGNNHQLAGFTTYSLSGAVSACQDGGFTATRYISSMQGFFIDANDSGNMIFKNSQRVANNNDNFASRTVNNKIWLDLTDDLNNYKQILIDFREDATEGFDRLYDARSIEADNLNFYSLAENDKYIIQALPELTDADKIIPLGYSSQTENTKFTIHLAGFEGALNDKNIFLYDSLSNSIHDLKQANYTFSTSNNNFDNRFQLLISNRSLSIISEQFNNLVVYKKDNWFILKSPEKNFNKITLFDIDGKLLYESDHLDQDYFQILNNFNSKLILFKIDFDNYFIVKKILN